MLSAAVWFAPPRSVVIGQNYGVVVAELNHDAVPDLLVSGSATLDHMVQTALGAGGGRFAAPTPFPLGETPGTLIAGDFNGDGSQDGVMVNGIYPTAALLPGDGHGGLGAPTHFTVGERAGAPHAADFNGDGKLDLALTSHWHPDGSGGGVRILLGDGTGRFAPPVRYAGGADTAALVSADFNRDGRIDLAASTSDRAVAVFLGNGAGGFSARLIPAGISTDSLDTGDFNGDGKADLVIGSFDGIAVMAGDGAGGFASPAAVPSAGRGAFGVADFDGNGVSDLVVPDADGRSVRVLAGTVGGDFDEPVSFVTGPGTGLAVADFDGDRRTDVATYAANGALNLLLNTTPTSLTVNYQAEQAALGGAAVSTSNDGFTGNGYVDYLHATGDFVEFTVQAQSAGQHQLGFRYANGGATARTLGLFVNGVAAAGGMVFAPTGSWRTWRSTRVTVPLAAGANTVRLVAAGQSGPNLDSISVRATEPPAAVTYQAEAAALAGPLALSNQAGYTGSGFADYQRPRGDSVEFFIDALSSGDYSLDFRYANGSTSDRPLELRVDGQLVDGNVSFAPTGSWRTWKTIGRTLALAAGRHTVRLTSVGSNGPNLDALTVTQRTPPPAPVTLEAESATLGAAVVGRGIPGFTGTGYVDYTNSRGDFVEFTYEAPSAGAYQLDFRYANGSGRDRTMKLSANGVVHDPSVSFVPTGSWSSWSTSTAAATLAAGPNRIRLTTTGANGPNLDALTLTARPSQGAVTYVLQARSISSGLYELYELYNPETDEYEEVRESGGDGSAAPDFGEFDAGAAARVTPPTGWQSGLASGTQHSRLTDGGVFVSGEFDGYTATYWGGYTIESNVDVTFELDRPRNYLLTYHVEGSSIAHSRVQVSLSKTGGVAVFEEVQSNNDLFEGTRAGALAPGKYRFVMAYSVGSDVGMSGPYSVELALTP